MGRPAHRPDDSGRRQVETLAGFGVPAAEIASLLAIDSKTLRKHYRDELRHGHTKANARPGDVLCVFSNGGFGGIHERLLG